MNTSHWSIAKFQEWEWDEGSMTKRPQRKNRRGAREAIDCDIKGTKEEETLKELTASSPKLDKRFN